ncbi:MAG: response regulator, partial [Gammaproteobacteria bacterium]|nr:response regulator [Gammaproteobacteria bacterium]
VSVEVGMNRRDTEVELTFKVKDTGIGISAEQQKRLFQSFSQADESVTRKYGGTGLGLAICKELVEMMQGEITLVSEMGKGSEFSFNVRLSEIEARTPVTIKNVQNTLSDLNVLVVDDVELSRRTIVDTLNSSGIKAQAVNDGQQAIEAVKESIESGELYDLILMDWRMPNLDGIQASRFIRQELQHDKPNILMVSAYDKDEVKKQASDILINGFIEKPVNQSQLLDHVMELISGNLDSRLDTESVQAPNLLNYRVLLVEDNSINQQVTLGFLADTHVQVDVANNGQVAVDMVQQNHYDLVLMDIQMPVMDGLTASQIIRTELKLDLPVIAMTAHAMEGDVQKSLAHGMNAHLTKPIDPDQLFQTLSHYLLLASPNRLIDDKAVNSEVDSAEPNALGKSSLTDVLQDAHNAEFTPWLTGLQQSQLLDLDDAIGKLKGKVKLYEGLIKDFVKANRDIAHKIEKSMASGDEQELYRIIHSLKSSAAYIGATALLRQTTELEQELAKGGSPSKLIQQVIASTEELVMSIDNMSISSVDKGVVDQLSKSQILDLLNEISVAAAAYNVDAESKAETLYQGCIGTEYEASMKSIYEEINDFEYEKALQQIEQVLSSLSS